MVYSDFGALSEAGNQVAVNISQPHLDVKATRNHVLTTGMAPTSCTRVQQKAINIMPVIIHKRMRFNLVGSSHLVFMVLIELNRTKSIQVIIFRHRVLSTLCSSASQFWEGNHF